MRRGPEGSGDTLRTSRGRHRARVLTARSYSTAIAPIEHDTPRDTTGGSMCTTVSVRSVFAPAFALDPLLSLPCDPLAFNFSR